MLLTLIRKAAENIQLNIVEVIRFNDLEITWEFYS